MPHELYLELQQDDILIMNGDEEDPEEGASLEDAVEAIPLYFYRLPLNGAVKLDIDFDPTPYNTLHLLFARYFETLPDGTNIPNWEIEEGTKPCDKEWFNKNVTIEDIEIYSLPVED